MQDFHMAITGGSTGIGLAIAARLIDRGCQVHLVARRRGPLEEAKQLLGSRAHLYCGDLTCEEDRQRLGDQLAAACPSGLDGVVLNAAKYGDQPADCIKAGDLEHYFALNTFGAYHFLMQTLPLIRKGRGKSILFISSTLALRPVPGKAAYSASKAALNSLATSLALELAHEKIRVNTINPGVVDTGIHEPQNPGEISRQEKMEMFAKFHPLGRVGQPDDVAQAAVYLLSPQAEWVTGSMFNVDGGISIA